MRKRDKPRQGVVASILRVLRTLDAQQPICSIEHSCVPSLLLKKPGLDVSTVAQLRDLALALVRLCDNGKPVAPVTVNAENAQVIVCDERRRAELIAQRERLLALEAGNGRKIEAAGQATWHNAETHAVENVGKTEEHALDIELKK